LHEGFLRVYRYEIDVEKHGGGIRPPSWEMMERGNAVAVLGHDPRRDEVVLANEFRPGAIVAGDYPYRDNLVAGGLESDETALEAAVREMQEEAGLVLSNPTLIHPGAYVSSGAHPRGYPSCTAQWIQVTRGAFTAMRQSMRTF
jgi:ADP-ribose pyrophosphatase